MKKGWGFVATSIVLILGVGYLFAELTKEDTVLQGKTSAAWAMNDASGPALATGKWALGRLWKIFSSADRTQAIVAPASDADRDQQIRDFREAATSMTLLSNKNLPLASGSHYWVASAPGHSFPAFLASAARFASVQELSWTEGNIPADSPVKPGETLIFLVESFGDARDSAHWWEACRELGRRHPVILVHFGAARGLQSADESLTLLHLPQRNDWAEDVAAQALFGGVAIKGRLPYRINAHFAAGHGIEQPQIRLQYAMPELEGVDREQLSEIDAIVQQGISRRAMPGAQVLVAKGGKIIYEKSFGHHTYAGVQPVVSSDLYDLASLTKAVGATLAVMRLYDQNHLNLNDRLRSYLGQYQHTGIQYLKIQHLLAHHSGLQANLPVADMMDQSNPLSARQDETYSWALGKGVFLNTQLRTSLLEAIKGVSLDKKPGLRYSDVNFVLLQQVVESVAKQPLDKYLDARFFGPMGLHRIGYRPTFRWPLTEIVPTAVDQEWRGGLVHGFPHDEGAFLLGGVAGNAGLFSNAADVAAVFQMLLNGGSYNGKNFLQPETVAYFTRSNGYNYRALGFDRLTAGYREVIEAGASPYTFGHTGFAGVCAWADPENDLVFVFLTNRIHPTPDNEKFLQMKLRTRVHRAIYKALGSYQALPMS